MFSISFEALQKIKRFSQKLSFKCFGHICCWKWKYIFVFKGESIFCGNLRAALLLIKSTLYSQPHARSPATRFCGNEWTSLDTIFGNTTYNFSPTFHVPNTHIPNSSPSITDFGIQGVPSVIFYKKLTSWARGCVNAWTDFLTWK